MYLPTNDFNPYRNVTPGMIGESVRNETSARPSARTDLGEFESFPEEPGTPRTGYQKIQELISSYRRRRTITVEDDDDEDDVDESEGAAVSEGAAGSN